MTPPVRFEDQVQVVLDVKPAVFSFVFGIPSADILEECRRGGIVTVGGATTMDEAIALEAAGVDVVIAAGGEAFLACGVGGAGIPSVASVVTGGVEADGADAGVHGGLGRGLSNRVAREVAGKEEALLPFPFQTRFVSGRRS